VEPTVHSFSAGFDPLRLISRYPEVYPGILESGSRGAIQPSAGVAAANHPPRFDVLPIACGESLRLDSDSVLSGRAAMPERGFLGSLEQWHASLARPAAAHAALPFRGGWLVYLGYEIAGEVEPKLNLPTGGASCIALALRAPAAWISDRSTGQCWVVAEAGFEHLIERFKEHVAEGGSPPGGSPPGGAPPGIQATEYRITEDDPAEFCGRVRRALEYIAAGDIYQANLSRGWRVGSTGPIDPVSVYRRLRSANPGPFSALLRFGDFAVVSSSPERLVTSDGQRVSSRPIAGTRPRGANLAEDEFLIRQLLDNEKEQAEHVMLIDLERNDLGRVCVGGSVKVDEFMSVETYAHVHHIVSNVSGVLRPGSSIVDLIRAVFPGGTITGCPKFRCMQIIAELEGEGRGAYTGSIGYINRDGSADFNILIRTMSLSGNELRFRSGAGIVADSDPLRELAETRAKAEGLLRAFRA
jgi:anthranilate synthase component 1